MKAFDTYAGLDAKLTKLLADNLLVHTFDVKCYPLTLTIRPDKDPEAQMAMFSMDDGACSADASLVFMMSADRMQMRISGRIYIDDALMTKIKGLAKKLCTAFLFGYFATQFTANGDDINYSGNPDKDAAASDDEEEAPSQSDDGGEFEGFFDDEEDDIENGGAEG